MFKSLNAGKLQFRRLLAIPAFYEAHSYFRDEKNFMRRFKTKTGLTLLNIETPTHIRI